MLNLGDEQNSIPQQDNFSRTNSEENLRTGHLNLSKVAMAPLHVCLSAPNWVDR